MGLEQSSFFSQ